MGLEAYRRTVSETKRNAILRSAQDIFLRSGYRRAAMAEIARHADVSTATLYKHFSSKEELFGAVVEEAYARFRAASIVTALEMPAEQAIFAAIKNYLHAQYELRMNPLLRAVIAEVPATPQLARELFEQSVQRGYAELAAVLDRLVARGLLMPHDTALGASQIGGMVKERLVWPALFEADYRLPPDADDIVRDAIRTYLARYAACN